MIGWRGAPGTPDEPQHITKGKITTRILKSLGIKYHILKSKNDGIKIVFITSILSRIQTFNRIIYSSMKVLQEKYLSKLDCSLLIITIATKIKFY